MKKCSQCKVEKDESEFNKSSKEKSGLKSNCRECQSERERARYHKNPEKKAEYQRKNKERIRAYMWGDHMKKWSKEYRTKNRERLTEYTREYRMKDPQRHNTYMRDYYRKNPEKLKNQHCLACHGITYQKKSEMIEAQGFKCLICGIDLRTLPDIQTHIDHNHVTGEIRSILCHGCNTAIGLMKEDIQILNNAIQYILKYNG